PSNRQLSIWNVPGLRMQLRQRIGPNLGAKDNLWSALASLPNRVGRVDINQDGNSLLRTEYCCSDAPLWNWRSTEYAWRRYGATERMDPKCQPPGA
ncbi:hypothetical protein V8F44DRAFT_481165, partial [Aspergillus fumigatus]